MRLPPIPVAGSLFAGLFVALFATAEAAGQQPTNTNLEKRIQALEESGRQKDARIRELERRADGAGGAADSPAGLPNAAPPQQTQPTQRRGISQLGQTTIFDSTFNPAFSLIGDFVVSATDADDTYESQNQFNLRDVELGVVGRIDPMMSYQVYLHFEQSEVEIEEAYVLADNWLPGTFMLKAGRFNMDFGKLSPIHEHDLPFLDKPQVLQEYVGGALRGTGAELHHYFGVGDRTLIRWTVGVVNELDGDAHAIFGPAAGGHEHHEEGPEPFGDRDFENFAYHGRLSALTEIGEEATLQVGTSVAYAPEARAFFDTGTNVISADLRTTLFGVDIVYKTLDPQTGSGFNIGGEFLISDRENSDDGMTITDVRASGYYGYVERIVNNNWSFGASGGLFEHAEDDSMESWDAGVFLSHRLNEFNRIRIEARHFDDPGPNSYGVALQWTVILGSHGHGIDW